MSKRTHGKPGRTPMTAEAAARIERAEARAMGGKTAIFAPQSGRA